jgi:putative transposase
VLWGDDPPNVHRPHAPQSARRRPQRLYDEISADYNDMVYAASAAEVERRRWAFIHKWRLKCKAVADSLEEAGDRFFTFSRLPLGQWKSARTTNAI